MSLLPAARGKQRGAAPVAGPGRLCGADLASPADPCPSQRGERAAERLCAQPGPPRRAPGPPLLRAGGGSEACGAQQCGRRSAGGKRTMGPAPSATLPSKIHLKKMKAHANAWRLLACAFNHGKLTLVPPGPPKIQRAPHLGEAGTPSAPRTRTHRDLPGAIWRCTAPCDAASSAIFLPKSCREGNNRDSIGLPISKRSRLIKAAARCSPSPRRGRDRALTTVLAAPGWGPLTSRGAPASGPLPLPYGHRASPPPPPTCCRGCGPSPGEGWLRGAGRHRVLRTNHLFVPPSGSPVIYCYC